MRPYPLLGLNRFQLMLLGVTAVWGSTFVIVHDLVHTWPPLFLLSIRFALATLILFTFLLRDRSPSTTWSVGHGLVLGSCQAIGNALQNNGLRFTTPSRSAFATAMVAVFVPVLATLLCRRPWRFGTTCAIPLACAGLFMLLRPGFGQHVNEGDLWSLASAAVYSIQIIALSEYPARGNPLRMAFVAMLWSTLLCGLLSYAAHDTVPLWSWRATLQILYLGVAATAVSVVVQVRAQAHVSATRAVFIFAQEPVFATALAWLLRVQHLTLADIVGGAAIFSASLLADRQFAALHRKASGA